MKSACVLVCLALAHGISANIFKRSRRPDPESLIVQPLDYINQYQQPLYRPQEQTYKQYIKAQKHKQFDSSSQESRERILDDYVPSRGAAREWSAPLYSTVIKAQNRDGPESAYGESIVWGFNLAAQPDTLVKKEIQMIFADAKEAMAHPTAEEKTRFHDAFTIATQKDEDWRLNATELLKKYEYPVEEHTVMTDDGYFLTLFRISAKKQQIHDVTAKPAVLLMHGLLGSADDWLLMGPGKSLAYLLVDAGYDVWLGNARGNKYSRRHTSKHPALNVFWQFSTDEVALHDLPAMIDYVLKTSAQEKLHYVGYSQGTTAFFAMAADFPMYNEKIISMHALAPMAYMKNTRSPLIRMVAPTSPFQARLRRLLGRGAFVPSAELISAVGGDMCNTEIGCKNVCSNVNFLMSGISIAGVSPSVAAAAVAHLPAGGSVHSIEQYGQAVSSGEFTKYSFGPMINSQVYGTVEPPKYNVSQVTATVTLYSAAEDWLAHPADVARLQTELPRAESYEVPEPHFSHMDFQFSTKAPELVYKKIIESMNVHAY